MKAKLALSDLLNQLSVAICIVRKDYTIAMANAYFQTRSGLAKEDIVGKNVLTVFPDGASVLKRKIDTAFVIESPSFSSWEQAPHVLPFQSSRQVSGQEDVMFQNLEFIPIHTQDGSLDHVCICVYDLTTQACQQNDLTTLSRRLRREQNELKKTLINLKKAQSQLLQSEKMASIGQLSAGIAHEINNPLGFITSNIQTLDDYFRKITEVVKSLEQVIDDTDDEALVAKKRTLMEQSQLAYVLEDVTDLISESLEGSSRVMAIVKNLKEFSHADDSEWAYSDLCQGLDSTLRIINNEIKYTATVELEYDDDLPLVYCQPMQLNQVFLNLLVNASQAIKENGVIRVSVQSTNDDYVQIKIQDNGTGIPEENLTNIFEPFFTTKPVGHGTGLGLSVSYGIINEHKGKIEVESEVGVGTTFTITLPVHKTNEQEAQAVAK
ncbi:sensor histidine kinase [Vibrio hepatarius]|uniref:sensor histidine kinase n=1 Tax=Vibrio hepatarius TaxID=171383 RepID=UPI00158876C0|nr:ATP-binding protein [Vibrio hepatarius]